MGLSDRYIKDLTLAWNATMGAVETMMLANKGYTWSLMDNENNANASPLMLKGGKGLVAQAECVEQLTAACSKTSTFQTRSKLFGVAFNSSSLKLTHLEQDIAFSLLARGPYP